MLRLRCQYSLAFQSHSARRWQSTSSSLSSCRDLKMYNSLTGQCEPFPRENCEMPNVLKWYACGPTVYDRAHLGHARAYVSQDILRRVAERTGGYKVQLVMGVTDVDDKIIMRAKEQNVPFYEFARDQEDQFFTDMAQLYVKSPTAITRVSEYLPEIIQYIVDLFQNGFAYEASDGSGVYFDTLKLGKAYGKLDPQRLTWKDSLLAERRTVGEDSEDAQGKKDSRDFALWKTITEDNEPSWPSPWGKGRPGWHIECSAMTHSLFGDQLDVHTGGIDLRFPHHNNEIAQCEAHKYPLQGNATNQWCNHFVHFGHLHIQGRKMSKSLKNFISVQEFLQNGNTADQFRLFCLQYKYRANLVYSQDRIRDAEAMIARLRGFVQSAVTYGENLHEASSSVSKQYQIKRCEQIDLNLLTMLFKTRAQVDEALLDDFDTPRALVLVLNLISNSNLYLVAHRRNVTKAPDEVLGSVLNFLLEMLDLFGLEGLYAEFSEIMHRRFPSRNAKQIRKTTELFSHSHEYDSLLRSLVQFRASVRAEALQNPKEPSTARILELCDAVRNTELPRLGIQIEDLAPGRSVYKLLSRVERQAAAVDKKTGLDPLEQKQRKFQTQMQISPTDFFKKTPEFIGRFDSFDANNFPTHENQLPLTKSQRKKLIKKLTKYQQSYTKYWTDQRND